MFAAVLAFLALDLILMWRNYWVWKTRHRWLDNVRIQKDLEEFSKISYSGMLFRLLNWSPDIKDWK